MDWVIKKYIYKRKTSYLLAVPLLFFGSPTSYASFVSIQHGNNFEDQSDLFFYLGLDIGESDLLSMDYGKSETEGLNRTIETDYYHLGYSAIPSTTFNFAADYNYSEISSKSVPLQSTSDAYKASFIWQVDNFDIGIHPEIKQINIGSSNNALTLGLRNKGVGLTFGYAFNDFYIYGNHYNYDPPNLTPTDLQRIAAAIDLWFSRNTLESNRIAGRQGAARTASELNDSSSSVGGYYYFSKVTLGLDYTRITPAFFSKEYDLITLSADLLLSNNWQAGVGATSTDNNSSNESYIFSLTYNW